MGNVLEQLQHIFTIAAFRSGGQTQNELRVEVGENLLVGVGCRMVAFVYNQVVKIHRRELFQILRDALHRGKNDRLGHILLTSGVLSQSRFRPDLSKGLFCLRCQLQGVDQKQRAPTHCLGVRCSLDGFAYAGCMVQQRNGLAVLTHLLQVLGGFLLVVPKLDGLSHLHRQVCFKCLEHGAGAQESNQLILDLFRLLFQLAVDPTVYFPVVIDQAVLFQEVISVFVFGHLAGVVVGLTVNLDCNFGFRRFQRKVDIAMPSIDVHAGVLDLQIFGFLRSKSLTEELHKQLLRTAVDAGCFHWLHGGLLNSDMLYSHRS